MVAWLGTTRYTTRPMWGRPAVVVGVGDQHDLLPRAPLLEPVGPGSDRSPIRRGLAEPPSRHVRLEQMLGQDVVAPGVDGAGVGLVVGHVDGEGIRRLHVLDEEVALLEGRRGLRVDHRLVREQHVGGGERLAVLPLHVSSQLERQVQAVRAEGPGLGERAFQCQVLVVADQPVVDEAADLMGGGVRREARNEPADVADGGLDERVAVGRRLRCRRDVLDLALDVAAARARRRAGPEQGQQSERARRCAHATSGRARGPATVQWRGPAPRQGPVRGPGREPEPARGPGSPRARWRA